MEGQHLENFQHLQNLGKIFGTAGLRRFSRFSELRNFFDDSGLRRNFSTISGLRNFLVCLDLENF